MSVPPTASNNKIFLKTIFYIFVATCALFVTFRVQNSEIFEPQWVFENPWMFDFDDIFFRKSQLLEFQVFIKDPFGAIWTEKYQKEA